jgi:hypothetical protein
MLLQGGIPHLTHPCPHFLYDPGPYVAVVYCGRFIFGPAEPPPQLVNQSGGFHSAEGTEHGGVPTVLDIPLTGPLPFGPSVGHSSFMGGAFPSDHLWASASGPPLFWSFHLLTSGGAFLLLITICWDVMDLIIKKEKKKIYSGVFNSWPCVPLTFWWGPPLEVQAIFHIYNINNNKHKHKMKNNRGEDFIKNINSHLLIGSGSPAHLLPILCSHRVKSRKWPREI